MCAARREGKERLVVLLKEKRSERERMKEREKKERETEKTGRVKRSINPKGFAGEEKKRERGRKTGKRG